MSFFQTEPSTATQGFVLSLLSSAWKWTIEKRSWSLAQASVFLATTCWCTHLLSFQKYLQSWKWSGSFPQEVHPAAISLANSSRHRAGWDPGTCFISISKKSPRKWIRELYRKNLRKLLCALEFDETNRTTKLLKNKDKNTSNWGFPRKISWDAYDYLVLIQEFKIWPKFWSC